MTKNTPLNNIDMDFMPDQSISFSESRFDEFVQEQGIELLHFRATRCPVGLIDQDDVARRPHQDHEGCSNGFIYTEAGKVTVLFYNNSLQLKMTDIGRGDSAGVQITFPRFYDKSDCALGNITSSCESKDEEPVLVAPFDRFYIKEDAGLEVVHWQLNQYNNSGVDRLSFLINKVIDLIDNQGKRYYLGDDFTIEKGLLKWNMNRGPGMDPKINKGRVYSIRYTYRPYFYVERMIREIRVAQIQDDVTGQRHVERMPQAAILQREYNFLSESSDKQKDAATARQPRLPASGSLGPR